MLVIRKTDTIWGVEAYMLVSRDEKSFPLLDYLHHMHMPYTYIKNYT